MKLAADVLAALVLCGLNLDVSMPASVKTILTQRLMVSLLNVLKGLLYLINWRSRPRKDCVLLVRYSFNVVTTQRGLSSKVWVLQEGFWHLVSSVLNDQQSGDYNNYSQRPSGQCLTSEQSDLFGHKFQCKFHLAYTFIGIGSPANKTSSICGVPQQWELHSRHLSGLVMP